MLLAAASTTGCYYRVNAPGKIGAAGVEPATAWSYLWGLVGGPQISVDSGVDRGHNTGAGDVDSTKMSPDSSATVWSLAWGIPIVPRVSVCSGGSVGAVTVRDLPHYFLLSLVTLGAVSPKQVRWQCAAPKPPPGEYRRCRVRSLAEVTIRYNVWSVLMSVATLGIASPKNVEGKCAPPAPTAGHFGPT
jgi:hypothetical protein